MWLVTMYFLFSQDELESCDPEGRSIEKYKSKGVENLGEFWCSRNFVMDMFAIRGRLFVGRMTFLKDHKQANFNYVHGQRNADNASSKTQH